MAKWSARLGCGGVTAGRRAFTLVELLVVLTIIMLLLAILIPALSAGKRLSRTMGCQSNLHQITTSYWAYTSDNRGQSFPYALDYIYMTWLKPYHGNIDSIRLCPAVTGTPIPGYAGSAVDPWTFCYNPKYSYSGSYAINGYMYASHGYIAGYGPGNDPGGQGGSGYSDLASIWPGAWWDKSFQGFSPSAVPLFMDSNWVDTWPESVDVMPPNMSGYITTSSAPWLMSRVAFNRHNYAINVAFVDGHAEAVPVQKLWSLQWSKVFKRQSYVPLSSN